MPGAGDTEALQAVQRPPDIYRFGAELKRRNVTYAQLVCLLADQGVMDSEPNIRNKINRGKFTAVFLVQCLAAIGVSTLRLQD